jgi:hypothetical protein
MFAGLHLGMLWFKATCLVSRADHDGLLRSCSSFRVGRIVALSVQVCAMKRGQ